MERDLILQARTAMRVAKGLGLTSEDLTRTLGAPIHVMSQGTLASQRALKLIKIYGALFSLNGGDKDAVQMWMRTANRGLGGTPAQLILTPDGLERVLEYLQRVSSNIGS